MAGSILIGLLASALALGPQLIEKIIENAYGAGAVHFFYMPLAVLGVAVAAIVLQRLFLARRDGSTLYNGLSDLMIHIHSPSTPDTPARWTVHGIISFLFALFGGVVGAEGAAAEICHGSAMRIRARSARWFEQRRRSDSSTVIAAAIAAAFQTPFAAILLSLELGIGGRTLSAVTSAFAAYLFGHFMIRQCGFDHFDMNGALDGFHFSGWASWVSPIVLGIAVALFSVILIRLIRYAEDSMRHLFHGKSELRMLLGAAIIVVIFLIYPTAHAPAWHLLEDVFWSRISGHDVGMLLLALVLSLTMVIAGFGTLGVFWPLFAIGGMIGFSFNQWIWVAMPGFSTVAGFAGATAIWGAVLGAPFSASVLVFELTGNHQLLLPCLIAGYVAKESMRFLRTPTLHQLELESRGMKLIDGRSANVLEKLSVREAMVTDHQKVHEHDPVDELHIRLLNSPYAFLPVVNGQGHYMGLLTADMIHEEWEKQKSETRQDSSRVVANLVGAKDVLYRSGFKVPCIKANDSLTASAGLFTDFPCVPVVDPDQKVVGLLFVHSVRLAYDREVARRSLSFEN